MRYLPLTADDRAEMLAAIGVDSIDALFDDVPEAVEVYSAICERGLRLEPLADRPSQTALA